MNIRHSILLIICLQCAVGFAQTNGVSFGLGSLRSIDQSNQIDTVLKGHNRGTTFLPVLRLTRSISQNAGYGCMIGYWKSRFTNSSSATIAIDQKAEAIIEDRWTTFYFEPFLFQQWLIKKYSFMVSGGVPLSVLTNQLSESDYKESQISTNAIYRTELRSDKHPSVVKVGLNATLLFQRQLSDKIYLGPAISFLVNSAFIDGEEKNSYVRLLNGTETRASQTTRIKSFETFMDYQFTVYCSYYF
jgi:hypothetical protein